MRVIIIDNPSESILRILLAGGVVSRTSLALSVPSIDKQDRGTPAIEPPYIPTPEELEAAANADIETLDVETPVPAKRVGRAPQEDSVRACMFRALANGPIARSELVDEVNKQRKAYGYEPSVHLSNHLDAISYKHKIVKRNGMWSLPSIVKKSDKQLSICE